MDLLSIAFAVLVVAVIAGELAVRLIVHGPGPLTEEFPITRVEELERFRNHDPELGWETKPGGPRPDSGHGRAQEAVPSRARASYSIAADGSRMQPEREGLVGPLVEFFGDSCCFCRDVEDHQTFAAVLEADHGVGPCRNFGVGNYGADQALLRAERRLTGDGSIAVLVVVVDTLNRLTALYKHYSELGNTWAVKPRFVNDDGRLRLVPRPITRREDLADLSPYRSYLRANDGHYASFRRYAATRRLRLVHVLLYPERWRASLAGAPEHRSRRQALAAALVARFVRWRSRLRLSEQDAWARALVRRAEGEEGRLFALICRAFCDLARSRGSERARIVVVPQHKGMRSPRHYSKAMIAIQRWCAGQDVEVHDFGPALLACNRKERRELGAYRGHLTVKGNRYLAAWLASELREAGDLPTSLGGRSTSPEPGGGGP